MRFLVADDSLDDFRGENEDVMLENDFDWLTCLLYKDKILKLKLFFEN